MRPRNLAISLRCHMRTTNPPVHIIEYNTYCFAARGMPTSPWQPPRDKCPRKKKIKIKIKIKALVKCPRLYALNQAKHQNTAVENSKIPLLDAVSSLYAMIMWIMALLSTSACDSSNACATGPKRYYNLIRVASVDHPGNRTFYPFQKILF